MIKPINGMLLVKEIERGDEEHIDAEDVSRGRGDGREHVGELLHDVVRERDQRPVRREGLGIADEEAARLLADPLRDVRVAGGAYEVADAVERAAAGATLLHRLLGPFVDQGKREAQVGGDLLGARPLGRKKGGRVKTTDDLTAGAGSGDGRLEKVELQQSMKGKRP